MAMNKEYRVWSRLSSGKTIYGEWGEDRQIKSAWAAQSRGTKGVVDAGIEERIKESN